MKSYNEYDEMFGESSQGYLVTSLPFSSSSTIIYANNRAASILELPSVSITGQTLGNIFPVFSTFMGSMDVGPFRHEPNGSLLRLFASPFNRDTCLVFVLDQNEAERASVERLFNYQRRMNEALEAANAARQKPIFSPRCRTTSAPR